MQCGLLEKPSLVNVLAKTTPVNGLYWHQEAPVHILAQLLQVPGCHLTICGGFHCVGKGLVNAYSFMVRLKHVLVSRGQQRGE